ncbi:hypothetical protein PJJ27_28955, partial [Mycobacterium kansasii]
RERRGDLPGVAGGTGASGVLVGGAKRRHRGQLDSTAAAVGPAAPARLGGVHRGRVTLNNRTGNDAPMRVLGSSGVERFVEIGVKTSPTV